MQERMFHQSLPYRAGAFFRRLQAQPARPVVILIVVAIILLGLYQHFTPQHAPSGVPRESTTQVR